MTEMVGVTGGGGGVNFWASETLSGRVNFEGYSPEWRVLSKLSVQPCVCGGNFENHYLGNGHLIFYYLYIYLFYLFFLWG